MSDESLLAHLPFALSFLRSTGCERAAEILLLEIGSKYPELPSVLGTEFWNEEARSAQQAAEAHKRTLQRDGGIGLPDVSVPEASCSSPSARGPDGPAPFLLSERAANLFSSTAAPPWGSELDEYETTDDVGYRRKVVANRLQFVEQELELASEEGSESAALAALQSKASGALGEDDGLDSHLESDLPDEAASQQQQQQQQQLQAKAPTVSKATHHAPPPVTHMPASLTQFTSSQSGAAGAQPWEAGPAGVAGGAARPPPSAGAAPTAAAATTSDEREWDMGPTDIKLVDPVTTPPKERRASEDEGGCRPVLSRVESLSSSFKDFDLDDDDQGLGGLTLGRGSRVASELSQDVNVVDFMPPIEFSPPATTVTHLAEVSAEALDLFARASTGGAAAGAPGHSRNSSAADVAPPPVPVVVEDMPFTLGAGPGQRVKEVKAKSEEPREVPGGFSFPVTPSAEDTDSKMFKSWPSVRSSSMSELAPSLDDVAGISAADYADDGYRSKLSSRTPSQRKRDELRGSSPGSSYPNSPGPSSSQARRSLTQPQQLQLEGGLGAGQSSAGTPGSGPASPASPATKVVVQPIGAPSDGGAGGADGTAGASATASAGLAEAAAAAVAAVSISGAQESGADAQPSALDGGASAALHASSEGLFASSITEREGAGGRGAGKAPPPGMGARAGEGAAGSSSVGRGGGAQRGPGAEGEELGGEEEGSCMDWQDASGKEGEEDEGDEELDEGEDEGGDLDMEGQGRGASEPLPKFTVDDAGAILYHFDVDYIRMKYEVFPLQVIHRRHHTGFEETKDFPIRMNDLIAGRYQVVDFLGSAAFSRAVQALDIKTNQLVCLKIVKNSKDYFDQSLDEIKLLKFVNSRDPRDQHGIVRLYDYFYYKEHLFLVCELLRANLYEFQKYNKESGEELYFTNARIQKIAISVLRSLAFLHSLGLIHSDLKPENILIKSYSRCEVKVIDLGSSCFTTDQLSSYVQSRSYRAPEVILGLPYDTKVDIWSLGCILAELSSGFVLFQNDSVPTLLARLEGILGRIPSWMVQQGRYANRFYTRSGQLYEHVQAPPHSRSHSQASASTSPQSPQPNSTPGSREGRGADKCGDRYELLVPRKTSLRHRVPDADSGLVDFVAFLLNVDPHKRPSAEEALCHPWLQHQYPSLDC